MHSTMSERRRWKRCSEHDPGIGRSRLTWLRTPPHSTSAPSMLALLERLTFVRAIALPRHLGDNIHPPRRAQFAREGAVAPANLLSDFGKRRRLASLAARMLELETTLTDAAIALFERLTGRLFTRSRNSQDRFSTRFSDYALEFYSFIADNYAPFYSTPIECTRPGCARSCSMASYITRAIWIWTSTTRTPTATQRSTSRPSPCSVGASVRASVASSTQRLYRD